MLKLGLEGLQVTFEALSNVFTPTHNIIIYGPKWLYDIAINVLSPLNNQLWVYILDKNDSTLYTFIRNVLFKCWKKHSKLGCFEGLFKSSTSAVYAGIFEGQNFHEIV